MERVWGTSHGRRRSCPASDRFVSSSRVSCSESDRALRVLETSHPPTIYVPPQDVRADLAAPERRARERLRVQGRGALRRRRRRGAARPAGRLDVSRPGARLRAAARPPRVLPGPRRRRVAGRRAGARAGGRLLRRVDHRGPRRAVQGRAGHAGLVTPAAQSTYGTVSSAPSAYQRPNSRLVVASAGTRRSHPPGERPAREAEAEGARRKRHRDRGARRRTAPSVDDALDALRRRADEQDPRARPSRRFRARGRCRTRRAAIGRAHRRAGARGLRRGRARDRAGACGRAGGRAARRRGVWTWVWNAPVVPAQEQPDRQPGDQQRRRHLGDLRDAVGQRRADERRSAARRGTG